MRLYKVEKYGPLSRPYMEQWREAVLSPFNARSVFAPGQ